MKPVISKYSIVGIISFIKPIVIKSKVFLILLCCSLLFNATASSNNEFNIQIEIPIHYGYLKLNIETNNLNHYTEFYFNSNATQGLDPGYDAVFGGTPPAFSIYSHLVENNTGMAFAVQALSNIDMNNITIPLGINANAGQDIILTIAETDIPEINIYIEDRVNNTLTRINDIDYTFTADTNLSGTGRFYVKFEADALDTTEQNLDTLKIYSNSSINAIFVKGALDTDTALRLFDINGRLVNYLILDASNIEHSIHTTGLSKGVYIVELTNKNSEKRTQKLIIE